MTRYSKEGVTIALQENPNMPDGTRSYFKAIRDGTLPDYYREEFRKKRDGYSSELPSEDVRNLIGDSERLVRYKCQGNYVFDLCLTLRGVMEDGVITDRGARKDIEQFLKSDLQFQVGDSANNKRMERINKILGRVLGKLG